LIEKLNSRSIQNSTITDQSTDLIELRDLRKSYQSPAGPIRALNNINLSLRRGEFVAVMGKSGAGKSTLVNMIAGIDCPDSGEIIIDGVPIHRLNEDERARWRGLNMGIVFQFFQLLPSISLTKNVTIPMEFCNRFTAQERKTRALSLLNQVGILDHANKKPSLISGGQQQRVAVARALANDPTIVVADEPTGNLDSKTACEILDIFSGLSQQGKTILIVTHDKTVAARADRIVSIADGELI
jgi:ABC-type lipoprotein export system ATPase subunit